MAATAASRRKLVAEAKRQSLATRKDPLEKKILDEIEQVAHLQDWKRSEAIETQRQK